MRKTIQAALFAAALALLAFPARADGLGRFEQEMKPRLDGMTLTYGGATALGPNGFALTDVRGTMTDEMPGSTPVPFTARRIAVEDIDFDHTGKDDGPHFLKMRVEGASADGEADDWLKQYGIPKVPVDFVLDYRLDADRKVFTLNRFELAMPGLARVELALILDGVTPASFKNADTAKDDVSLRTATLVYEDASLLGKLVPAIAAEQKKKAEEMIAETLSVIGVVAMTQSPPAAAIFDAIASYIGDYRQPKGPLRVTVAPPKNLSTADLDKIELQNAIVDVFGVSASYAGTRAGAAKAAVAAASASTGAAAAPPAKGGVACKPGERLFALSDGGWWQATVREATQSGQRCVVRLEGSDSDEDVVLTSDKMMGWSIDGPGEAAKGCRKGERVWIKSEGAWYPALVRQTPKAGAPCTVRLEDDDDAEDETVDLRRIRIVRR